jgi:hypothetical protein
MGLLPSVLLSTRRGATLDILDHGFDRFNQGRNIILADVKQVLGIDLGVAVRQDITHSQRAAPLHIGVMAQQRALGLAVDIFEFLSHRDQDHADRIHPIDARIAGGKIRWG